MTLELNAVKPLNQNNTMRNTCQPWVKTGSTAEMQWLNLYKVRGIKSYCAALFFRVATPWSSNFLISRSSAEDSWAELRLQTAPWPVSVHQRPLGHLRLGLDGWQIFSGQSLSRVAAIWQLPVVKMSQCGSRENAGRVDLRITLCAVWSCYDQRGGRRSCKC